MKRGLVKSCLVWVRAAARVARVEVLSDFAVSGEAERPADDVSELSAAQESSTNDQPK